MIPDAMLITSCPECTTTFRVSVGILEKAGGQVRCGKCAEVFDANIELREIDDTAATLMPEFEYEARSGDKPQADDASAPAASADEAASAQSAEQLAADSEVETKEPETTAEAEEEPKVEAVGEAVAEAEAEAEAVTEAETATEAETETDLPNHESSESDSKPAAIEADGDAETIDSAPDGADAVPDPLSTPDWLPPVEEPRNPRTWVWASGAAVLCLTLAGQMVHQFRGQLVSIETIGPAIEAVYAGLGIEVQPAVDLNQYNLLDLTALAEPAGEDQGWLIIETRVQNAGPKVQPFPHIFVRLLDRWEDTVAGRYFGPDEYTVSDVSDYSRMNIGTTVDAQFIIMDPGPSATGFELELCTKVVQGFACESDLSFQ